jgi:DNA recombination protein Rad52
VSSRYELTEEQLATLNAPLDAKRVKTRESGRGPALSYLETHDVIRMANGIFGIGKWGHEIVDLRQIPGVMVTSRDGKTGYQTGYVCIVRLIVQGCIPVSGVGYGDAVEYRDSAPVTAHELAAKEAESDALKRALKNFGDQFGLALYDKAAGQNGHLTYDSPAPTPGPSHGEAPQASTPVQTTVVPGTDGWTWPFGKHKGATLADTPDAYLDWFLEKSDKEDIKDRIRQYREGFVGVGASGAFDDDIPFMPTIDGLGG